MIRRGPRRKQVTSFAERLAQFSQQARERAVALPPSVERAALMKKLEQTEQAVRISEWLNSPAPKANQSLNKGPGD
jgi:Tfp pilus assembly protein FimT